VLRECVTDPLPSNGYTLHNIILPNTSTSSSSDLFPSGFPTKIIYTFFFYPMRATFPAHLILGDVTRLQDTFIVVDTVDVKGRAIVQAVSRLLPTAAARVRSQVRSCGICGGQSGTGAGFLRVPRFPLPIRNPPTAPRSSSSIIRGWYNRPVSGRGSKWAQSHLTLRN
jgi:hypothetical protein